MSVVVIVGASRGIGLSLTKKVVESKSYIIHINTQDALFCAI